MAKKKAANSKKTPAGGVFQVRIEPELHERLRKHAESAELTLNQLVKVMIQGCVDNLVQGEAEVEKDSGGDVVRVKEQKKCVFFGRGAVPNDGVTEERRRGMEYEGYHDDDIPGVLQDRGAFWFGVDFSERGYVRPR